MNTTFIVEDDENQFEDEEEFNQEVYDKIVSKFEEEKCLTASEKRGSQHESITDNGEIVVEVSND